MITLIEISDALAVCDAASKGPALWAADASDTPERALERFAAHYNKATEVTGSAVLHQVDLPDARTERDGTALCFAVTGNGPNGAPNARFIAGALDPRIGWEAMLREVLQERAISMKLDAVILEAISAIADFQSKNDPTDAYLAVQQIDDILMRNGASGRAALASANRDRGDASAAEQTLTRICELLGLDDDSTITDEIARLQALVSARVDRVVDDYRTQVLSQRLIDAFESLSSRGAILITDLSTVSIDNLRASFAALIEEAARG